MYHIYTIEEKFPIEPEKIIVEDSNSGYEFFKDISAEKICVVADGDVKEILEEPEKYIDSKEYFTWERFFTKMVIEKTKDFYLKYSKSKLNPNYLHEKNKERIVNVMQGIKI